MQRFLHFRSQRSLLLEIIPILFYVVSFLNLEQTAFISTMEAMEDVQYVNACYSNAE